MSDNDKDKNEAVDKIAGTIKIAIRGWPIYGIIIAGLYAFGQLWLDDYIAQAISDKTLEIPAVVIMQSDVVATKEDVDRIELQLDVVKQDTTAILLHLAGE